MANTLPEITIVGRPGAVPITVPDWFAEGFATGWRDPREPQEPPAPLNEEALAAFFDGARSGAKARRHVEFLESSEPDTGPGVEPEIGGRLFEEVQREWDEAWAEFLGHEDPHDEMEQPEIELHPGVVLLP